MENGDIVENVKFYDSDGNLVVHAGNNAIHGSA